MELPAVKIVFFVNIFIKLRITGMTTVQRKEIHTIVVVFFFFFKLTAYNLYIGDVRTAALGMF